MIVSSVKTKQKSTLHTKSQVRKSNIDPEASLFKYVLMFDAKKERI